MQPLTRLSLSFHFLLSFFILCFCSTTFFAQPLYGAPREIILRDRLEDAQAGDYLIVAQHKNYIAFLVRSKDDNTFTVEEITLPASKKPKNGFSWRSWIENGAPGNTSWIMYIIQLKTGTLQKGFSFTRNEWFTIPSSQNFLTTLLNLRLEYIPESERKKVGPPPDDALDRRPLWQPKVVVEGKTINGVQFDAWQTTWPKDGSELAGKFIEVYLPKERGPYPSYFPYWLQVSNLVAKAKVRIVDSGTNLFSKKSLPK